MVNFRSRCSRLFPMALLVLAVILVLNSSLFKNTISQSNSPTEVADNIFISIQINHGETTIYIDNQSEYYFRTGLPDFSDLEVYDDGKWSSITTENISLLMAGIVPPFTSIYEVPYWSETVTSLKSGLYRLKFSGIQMQTTLSQESTLNALPDTYVPFTIQ